jgi:hypothetical protein
MTTEPLAVPPNEATNGAVRAAALEARAREAEKKSCEVVEGEKCEDCE